MVIKENTGLVLQNRLDGLVSLGKFIEEGDASLDEVVQKAYIYNPWFTPENTRKSLANIATEFLDKEKLANWLKAYVVPDEGDKAIAVVSAGNLPLVAFHDILCVLASGNSLLLKLSDKDRFLLPFLLEKLVEISPDLKNKIAIRERLEKFDGIIATGSNNAATYFHSYFGKYKNIIRHNRNSVAVLTGEETNKDIELLGADIFDYFGLGCRNVSKIFIPRNFDLLRLKQGLTKYETVSQHTKYMNNLDYQRTLFLMNQTPMVDIDFINIVESKSLQSPISVLHYEYYDSVDEVNEALILHKENIQCIVGKNFLPFGSSQRPTLTDYSDNIDTMQFILNV